MGQIKNIKIHIVTDIKASPLKIVALSIKVGSNDTHNIMECIMEERKKKICRYYTSSAGCRFGADCWFYHPTAEEVLEEKSVPEPLPPIEKHSIICKCGGKVLEESERMAVERLTDHVFESYVRLDRDHLNVLDACLTTNGPFRTLSCKVCTKWTNNKSLKLIRHYCQRAQGSSKHSEDHRNQLKEFCRKTIDIFKDERDKENTNELSKLLANLNMKESSSNVQSSFETLLVGDTDESDSDGDFGCYGFSSDDVEELLCQGIKPWDPEAGSALAVLYDDFY